MPYVTSALSGDKWQVRSPSGIKAKRTTKKKAKKQVRLLNAIEHGWRPSKQR